MNRNIRMRRYSSSGRIYDILFPQTVTGNILRGDGVGVLESSLLQYDRHLSSNQVHMNHAVSAGTYRELTVTIPGTVLEDGFPLMLTLHTNLECEPTLSFNGAEPAHIISADGSNIPGGQLRGSVLFLVWSEFLSKWILLSSDTYSDVTKVLLPVETEYVHTATMDGEKTFVIPDFDKASDKIVINYGQTILRSGIDYAFVNKSVNTIELIGFALSTGDMLYCTITKYVATAKRGTLKYDIETVEYPVTIEADNTSTVNLPAGITNAHSIVVNYGQTILRNTLDYNYSDDGASIVLTNIKLSAGEIITFRVTRFIESNGEILPNNWGATGNYRYSLDVIHTEYTATENNITVIPVPSYNFKADDIWPIYNNKLLIYDVDYTIDEIGQVVLLTMHLDRDDTIYFTILKGAMMDVPNFNVIRASGDSGQHILLNMSYTVLCSFYTILVELTHDLETNPTIKTIDGPAEPVCDCFGNPIMGGYKAGSYLWLVYNFDKKCWYSLGHSQLDITSLMPSYNTRTGEANFIGQPFSDNVNDDNPQLTEAVIEHGLGTTPTKIEVTPCEPPNRDDDGNITTIGDIWTYADDVNLYVGNSGTATSKFKWSVSTEDDSADLRTYIDQQIAEVQSKPGKFETKQFVYTAEEENVVDIEITDFTSGVDKLIVNYGQTVLRENIDYTITDTGVHLETFVPKIGDIVQFTIIVQNK